MIERKQRIIDWRFMLAMALFVAVCYLTWAGLDNAQQAKAQGHRADRLYSLVSKQRDDATQVQHEDALEREALLAQVKSLNTKYDSVSQSYRQLIRYLQNHGIAIPTRLVQGSPVVITRTHTKVVTRIIKVPVPVTTNHPSKAPSVGPSPSAQASHSSAPPSKSHASAPAGSHGNSASAPGHLKHPK